MAGTVIVFVGEYDFACKERLREELREAYTEPNLILDLSDVSYIDASFVTELVRLHQARRRRHFVPEVVVLCHPMLQRLFDILDLGNTFRVVGSLGEALADNGKTISIQFAFHGDAGVHGGPLPCIDDRTIAAI
jgi:anti-anti-sigma factor